MKSELPIKQSPEELIYLFDPLYLYTSSHPHVSLANCQCCNAQPQKEDRHTFSVAWINEKVNSNGIKNVVKHTTVHLLLNQSIKRFRNIVRTYESAFQNSFKIINRSQQAQSLCWSVSFNQFYHISTLCTQLYVLFLTWSSWKLIWVKYKLKIDVISLYVIPVKPFFPQSKPDMVQTMVFVATWILIVPACSQICLLDCLQNLSLEVTLSHLATELEYN